MATIAKGVGDVATLHHAGSEKLATTSTGIDVTGTVTSSGPINLTAGALAAAGNAGLSHRSADNKVYLQAGTGGFNILDDQQNTHFFIDSAGVSSFNNKVGIGTSSINSNAALEVHGGQLRVASSSASSMFAVATSTTYSDGVTLFSSYNGSGAYGPMIFDVNGERMRLRSDGNLNLGDTSNSQIVFQMLSRTDGANTIHFGDADSGNQMYNGYINYQHGSSPHLAIQVNNAERMRIDASGMLAVPQWYTQTTALGATAYVAAGPQGAIYRSTSSIKYKRDVETIQDIYADALLDVRPVFYRSKSDNDNSAHGFWGIIAEELAEIDPRLVHWQTHVPVESTDDDGVVTTEMVELDTPEPEGVQYERFVPLLINLAKRQRDQITAQAAAITDLTTRLTALENN